MAPNNGHLGSNGRFRKEGILQDPVEIQDACPERTMSRCEQRILHPSPLPILRLFGPQKS